MCREVSVDVPVGNTLNKRPESRVCEITSNSAWLEQDWWGGVGWGGVGSWETLESELGALILRSVMSHWKILSK